MTIEFQGLCALPRAANCDLDRGWGARGVSPAVFGVSPKTSPLELEHPLIRNCAMWTIRRDADWRDRDATRSSANCIVAAKDCHRQIQKQLVP
jgi:hypothetical protein